MSDAPARGFAVSEYEARTARAQDLMAQQEISGLFLMTEPEVRYFSGFLTPFWQSPTRPWYLFVPATGKPVAIIPEIGADLMRRSWLDDIRTWAAPSPADDGISLLVDLLTPFAQRGEKIGVLKGHETGLRMPLGDYERLISALPGLNIADATGLVRNLRMVKSEAEIEKIAHICGIGSRGFACLPDIAKRGLPFDQLFREFRKVLLDEGADDVPYLVGGAAAGGYTDVISPPSNRPLSDGDVVMLDTGSVWDGYFCDFDRNISIGPADNASCRAHDVLWRATEAAINAVKPGMTCRDLFHVMKNVISELDDKGGDIGRFGHGLGMQLTEWPSIAAFDDTVIQENMVLTLEPSLSYGDGRAMAHEENIVVRAHGAELLTTRAAPELPEV